MARQRIHIERLRIRLPRAAAATVPAAREQAAGVGRDVLRAIAGALQGQSGTLRIDDISTKGCVDRVAGGIAGDVREQWTRKGRA